MNLYDYAKLSKEKKQQVLQEEALFIENYEDAGSTINVYLLNDFFVEITFKKGVVTDNIPFQRGYKLHPSKLEQLKNQSSLLVAA